jgi:hypothetical protein
MIVRSRSAPASGLRTKLIRARQVLRQRFRSPLRLLKGTHSLRTHPAYLTWLTCGQPRPLEARIIRRTWGFLPAPKTPLCQGKVVEFLPTPQLQRSDEITSIRIPGVEDRWKLRVSPSRRHRIQLRMDSHSPIQSRMLFVNGQLHGYFPVAGSSAAVIDVRDAGSTLEFSLRLSPGHLQPNSPVSISLEFAE